MTETTHDLEVLEILSKLIHREILRLIALIGIAIAAFFVTRAIAANNRQMSLEDAAVWFRKGQDQYRRGRLSDAIDSFRRALLRNRGDKSYTLAFARALSAAGDTTGAQNALLSLRQSAPEDPVINLELARLARRRRDDAAALRYYQNALYAPWPAAQVQVRQQIRIEMIRFLLAEHDTARAVPELIALANNLENTPAAHLQLGGLFMQAGDPRRALTQFDAALREQPRSAAAAGGAARAAFQAGDYAVAARHLAAIPRDSSDLMALREVVNWVLRADPLAPRVRPSERRRRLLDNVQYATRRLESCAIDTLPTSDAAALRDQATQFRRQLTITPIVADTILDAGVDLVAGVISRAVSDCPPAGSRDEAMRLIRRRHATEQN